jgi:hypothetical protein
MRGAKMRKGTLLAEDDMIVGQVVCIHSIKRHPNRAVPLLGMSLKIKSLNFPFVLGEMISDPNKPVLTLDVRHLNFMRVAPDYAGQQTDYADILKKQMEPPQQ